MKRRTAALLASLCAGTLVGLAPVCDSTAVAASPEKSAISQDARTALAQMGTALLAKEFSFHARTIRVYSEDRKSVV